MLVSCVVCLASVSRINNWDYPVPVAIVFRIARFANRWNSCRHWDCRPSVCIGRIEFQLLRRSILSAAIVYGRRKSSSVCRCSAFVGCRPKVTAFTLRSFENIPFHFPRVFMGKQSTLRQPRRDPYGARTVIPFPHQAFYRLANNLEQSKIFDFYEIFRANRDTFFLSANIYFQWVKIILEVVNEIIYLVEHLKRLMEIDSIAVKPATRFMKISL